jgi:hypothetical protein
MLNGAAMERTVYEVDERDQVIEMTEVPRPSVGAPLPILLCDENQLVLSYDLPEHAQNEGAVGCTVIRFIHPQVHMFGSPNDEALQGHPLWSHGLRSYRVYRVEGSSWVRQLERMNSVHPRHDPSRFEQLNHFIFTFHDSVFECVAKSFEVATVRIPREERLSRLSDLILKST